MGKALIIKNADFSANAVTTITFADVPCTGISFDSDTVTITGYEPVTVGYTLTPADTTDSVIWESSDTSVVTVSNGVLTVAGIGTCTITATCGAYSASATITVSISYIPNWKFGQAGHVDGAEFITVTTTYRNRIIACGSGAQEGAYSGTGEAYKVVKIPNNTASVTISRGADKSSMFYNDDSARFLWTQDVSCGNSSYPFAALWVSADENVNFSANQSHTYTVPEGADSFLFMARLTTTYTDEDVPGDIASSAGIEIVFNTAA